MFDIGDCIVHPRYGAGTVIESRVIERKAEKRRYFCIELTNSRGTVMIPSEKVEETGLRPIMVTETLIREVMSKQPVELSDNHRSRQADLEAKLKSRKPLLLLQALRDLNWREHTTHLTNTDRKLKNNFQKRIVQEFALLIGEQARVRTQEIVLQAMTQHLKAITAEA